MLQLTQMKTKTLFADKKTQTQPLAARMRPKTFKEYVGQEELVGKGKSLRELIEQDKLSSLILWGPPGSGKTSLAYLVANVTKSHFVYLSAVDSSLGEMRKVLKEAEQRLETLNQRTILTIDEIHRFNRLQQAALLPYTEEASVILVGCTTENPYFEVIGPLVSRSTVYKLNPLSKKEIKKSSKTPLLKLSDIKRVLKKSWMRLLSIPEVMLVGR